MPTTVKKIKLFVNSLKNSSPVSNNYNSIALSGVKPIDIAIHGLVRMLIIFVSFTSKLPGILFLVPAIINAHFPLPLFNRYLERLFSYYLLSVALFIILCITLYFVSENPAARERLCRYLDAPDIVYPADFDEEKERSIAERGFTYKYLGDERDHTARVISVPIAIVCLSTTLSKAISACVFGM